MSRLDLYKFRLYIAGETDNSVLAAANLAALGNTYLAGKYELEIVDVLREPKRALADAVFMTPVLLKLAPTPQRRIVGTLGNLAAVLGALGLQAEAA